MSTTDEIRTPSALRKRSRNNLISARAALDAGVPDDAAYLAGNAAELAIKARWCSKNSKKFLPPVEELRRVKLVTHDLEKLLTISETAYIKRSSMNRIDWDAVLSWENVGKYDPVGSIDCLKANQLIEQTTLLLDELDEHEIVHSLKKMIDSTDIRFNLLAIENNTSPKHHYSWRLHVSSTDFDDETLRPRRLGILKQAFVSSIPEDLLNVIPTIDYWGWGDSVTQGLASLTMIGKSMRIEGSIFVGNHVGRSKFDGCHRLTNCKVGGVTIKSAYVFLIDPPTR